MGSIFSKIIQGEIPACVLAEDDQFFSFLDIRPINQGHALVIPKEETDYLFDLEDPLLGGLLPFARPIAKAIEKVVPCERVGVMVAGLEVPHAHVHLIPFSDITELNFANAQEADPSELNELAAKIRKLL